jgi:DNA-binding transcriptional MerR regulator
MQMTQSTLTIGTLATLTQCSIPTIRYYEQIGLLPHAQRAGNGHRFYREDDVRRLGFIKRCRDFGFPIEQVKQLAGLFDNGDRACSEVRDLAQGHLDDVRVKLEELRQLETSLANFVDSCNQTCKDGTTRDCAIVADLTAVAVAPSGTAAACCPPLQGTSA